MSDLLRVVSTILIATTVAAAGAPASPAHTQAADSSDLLEVGWHDEFETDRGWRQEPWLVRDAAGQASTRFSRGDGAFTVPAPGQAMAWTRTTTPIWVDPFARVELDYRIDPPDGDGEVSLILSDDCTGPITPGALNPENPVASGSEVQVRLPSAEHKYVLNLRDRFKSDRVARITFLVRSRSQAMRFHAQRLAFRADESQASSTQPSSKPARATLLPADAAPSQESGQWNAVPRPSAPHISAEQLCRAFNVPPSWPASGTYHTSGVAFELAPAGSAAAATGMMETGGIKVSGQWKGSELALLLATRVFGSQSPWQGGLPRPRGAITSPHQILVRLEYADGTQRRHFPWSVVRRTWSIERPPEVYVVPLDPERTLTAFEINEQMDFGQVFLLAASINQAAKRAFAVPAEAKPTPRVQLPSPQAIAGAARRDRDTLSIENAWLHLTAEVADGFKLREFSLKPLNRPVIAPASPPAPFLELLDAKNLAIPMELKDLRIDRREAAVAVELMWAAQASAIEVRLVMAAADNGEISLAPTIANTGQGPWNGSLVCPRLGGCRIADSANDRWYLLGTRSTILDNAPIKVEKPYCGDFPLPFIDLFAPQSGGGLGLLVRDTALVQKTFRFEQSAGGTLAAVSYPQLVIPPGGQLKIPAAVLFCHLGDWHDAFHRYLTELRSRPDRATAARMSDVFYCRRDYPLGGTGYLFDAASKHYTPLALIEESLRAFEGADMIDISGWAYHEATGRVGEYRTNDLGGLQELRRAVDAVHERQIKVGLYFEGYLIDRRAPLAKTALPAWQIIDRNGKPKWWSGEMEFFACPGVAKWREELAGAMADVAAETGADAVYADEFGFAGPDKACWSPDHGHAVPSNPLIEEQRMLTEIRRALDRRSPKTAIYVEQVPCDVAMGLVDGAFNYGMVATGMLHHVTCLPLHRFAFPEMSSIEMVGYGIRPVPVSEDDLHRCIFHGLSLWLKGRGDSWYSDGFRETARRAQPIFHRYREVFRSPQCEPLIPTLEFGVYANRFATDSAIILTVYNARHSDVDGELLETTIPSGWHIRDLWNDRPAQTSASGGKTIIRGSIEPRSVTVFLLSP